MQNEMQNHLAKDSGAETKTVTSQVVVGETKPVDRLTISGSMPGDFRAEAQGNTSPLRGNDNPVRSETESEGA